MYSYYEWLLSLVDASGGFFSIYSNLLQRMHLTDFFVLNPLDNSRATDGKLLRHYFLTNRDDYAGYTVNVASEHPIVKFDPSIMDEPCTILEMMIALCRKIDSQVLYSYDEVKLPIWFWMMVRSLGLEVYDDFSFDSHQENNPVDQILFDFVNQSVDQNGRICKTLFGINDFNRGEKTIWQQMERWANINYNYLMTIDKLEFYKEFDFYNRL